MKKQQESGNENVTDMLEWLSRRNAKLTREGEELVRKLEELKSEQEELTKQLEERLRGVIKHNKLNPSEIEILETALAEHKCELAKSEAELAECKATVAKWKKEDE